MASEAVALDELPVERLAGLRPFLANPAALIGVGLATTLILLSVLAPLLTPFEPLRQAGGLPLTPPGPGHPMGTDDLRRDVFARSCTASGYRWRSASARR